MSFHLQLKKFQSKNKGKPKADSVLDTESYSEPTKSNPDTVEEQQCPSSTSSICSGSVSASATHIDTQLESVTMSNANQQTYMSDTMTNYSQLSKKFNNFGLEIGHSLASSDTTELLETQVHELTRKLNEERLQNQNLEVRLREQYGNVDELKLKLQHSEVGSISKVQTELGPLRDQLDNQIRTVAILVGEKAELAAQLATVESLSKVKELENEELHAKLGASRHQVQKLKEEQAHLKKSQQRFDSSQQNLCTEVENTRDELKQLRRSNDDLKEECLELRRKFDLKTIEFNSLQGKHKEKLQEIECLHLRLTQLVGADEDPLQRDRALEADAHQRIALEAQIQELLAQVEKANADRETAASHYQNYVQQLNKEREGWIVKVQEVTKERDELAKRDQQLVQHIGELEKQMQQSRSMQAKGQPSESSDATESNSQQCKDLEDTILKYTNDLEVLQGKLGEERENVHKMSLLLREKEDRIELQERECEQLRNSHVDPQQISATLESEKVAASRAMIQNQQLRAQLEEMQTAFVQMTNDKANLMTELESEKYLGREMRNKFGSGEEEAKALRQKLHFKDEEMIRMAHEGTEQSKRILVLEQELDQMRHLEVNTRNQGHLQVEIVKQREQISRLQAQIRAKEDEAKQLNSFDGVEGEPADAPLNPMDVSVAEEIDEGLKATDDAIDQEIIPEQVEVQELPTGEAMLKLQARFTRTMDEIAELTEEKQRLEHLVIQLQGETETIGEYIALYQNQRKLLRQREIEKDIQVQRITADREEMKDKLQKLNALVEQMLTQRNIMNPTDSPAPPHLNGVAELAPAGEGAPTQPKTTAASRETAEQILDLLTEIKTQNTNFLTDAIPTPCSCCSGQLITV